MDLITHAVTGYFVGGPAGIVGAILPDVVMVKYIFTKPSGDPPPFYHFTHSLLYVVAGWLALGWGLALGILTHLILDQFTHGSRFSPRWLYPGPWSFSLVQEWTFLSPTWWVGIGVALCLILIVKLPILTGYL